MTVKQLVFAISLFLTPLGATAQNTPPTLSTSLSTDTIMIGDQAKLEFTIAKDVAQEVGLPQFKDNKIAEKVELVGNPAVDTLSVNGRDVKLKVSYNITSFDAGTYYLRGFSIVWKRSDKASDTIFSRDDNELTVTTFEIDTTKQSIYDIKKPMETPFMFDEIWAFIAENRVAFLAGAGVAVVIGIGVYFLLRHLSRRRRRLARAVEPPHVTALRELYLLREQQLWQQGLFHQYYSELADIIREFISARFDVSAMEMTTPEILLAIDEMVDEKQLKAMRELFTQADLAKFAKFAPAAEENEENFSAALDFVEQTKLLTPPPVLQEPNK